MSNSHIDINEYRSRTYWLYKHFSHVYLIHKHITNMKHQRTYVQPPGEKNGFPSLTIPGQTLPIRTLVERYRRGAEVTMFNGEYNEDESVTGIAALDKVDRAQLALHVKENVRSQRAQLQSFAEKELLTKAPEVDAITSLDV